MELLRIYLDTSVFGGCFDAQFAEASARIFRWIHDGRFRILVSEIVTGELEAAPTRVQEVFDSLPDDAIETVAADKRVDELVEGYLRAEVVGARWRDDATHVALATVAGADAIISWNFKHMVRLDRIMAYNLVNKQQGYGPLTILSPLEVVNGDENEKDIRLR